MIELLFLIFFLPKRMSTLARERDLSPLKWTLAAAGAWLGVEFLIIFAWFVISTTGSLLWGWPEPEKSPLTLFVYFLALIGGMIAADLVRRGLTAKPITREVKQWKGIWG